MKVTDRLLIRCGMLVALLGIGALLLIHQVVEMPLSDLDDDGRVRVEATVLHVNRYGNVTRLRLSARVERDAVIFAPIGIIAGDRVEVLGEVGRYRGEPEILVDEIRILN